MKISDSLKHFTGSWSVQSVTDEDFGPYVMKFSRNGEVTLEIAGQIRSSSARLSDKDQVFPKNEGWLRIDNLFDDDTSAYIRMQSDGKFFGHFFCQRTEGLKC